MKSSSLYLWIYFNEGSRKVRYKILNASSIEIRVLQGCRIRLASVPHKGYEARVQCNT